MDSRAGSRSVADQPNTASIESAPGYGDKYGSDESLIAARLWPTIRDKTFVYTEFDNRYAHGGIIRPFPTRRAEGLRFIGERIYDDNQSNGDDRDCYVAARLAFARY